MSRMKARENAIKITAKRWWWFYKWSLKNQQEDDDQLQSRNNKKSSKLVNLPALMKSRICQQARLLADWSSARNYPAIKIEVRRKGESRSKKSNNRSSISQGKVSSPLPGVKPREYKRRENLWGCGDGCLECARTTHNGQEMFLLLSEQFLSPQQE